MREPACEPPSGKERFGHQPDALPDPRRRQLRVLTPARGVLLTALAAVLVGCSFTANSVLGDYPYAGGQFLRYGLACLLLLPLLGRGGAAPLRTLTARRWARLALLAAVGMVGFNLAVIAAERSAEPAVPGVFVGCAPVVVAVLVAPAGRAAAQADRAVRGVDRRGGRVRGSGVGPYGRCGHRVLRVRAGR